MVILGIALVILTFGSLQSSFFFVNGNHSSQNFDLKLTSNEINYQRELVFGTGAAPIDLDPQNSWDSSSSNVIIQVCEGLFMHDYTLTDSPLVPRLAHSFGTWNGNNYTVDIRSGIKFHDGTDLDVNDVVWTFNRLENLNSLGLAKAYSLYEYYDIISGTNKPIINQTIAVDSNTVKFVLNTPYGPFEELLSFEASYILPSEGQIPYDDVIDKYTDDLIGTGPFDFQYYIADKEIKFSAFEDYWRGRPKFDNLTFSLIYDHDLRNEALLNGSIDILNNPGTDYLSEFNSSIDIDLVDAGNLITIYYLGMNNRLIPVDVRKAISYALNYSFIIEVLYDSYADRLKSPIPKGIAYSNYSLDVPYLNITHARSAMQDAGYGLGLDPTYGGPDDATWRSSSFLTYNYTYNIGNTLRENLLYLLQDNLEEIGITIIDAGITWVEFLNSFFELGGRTRDDLNLYWIGWLADYNDPSNYINPLFTNRQIASNHAQVNDTLVQIWMEQALVETDPIIREQLYDSIQKRLIEEVYPLCWGIVPDNYDAINSKIEDYPSNVFDKPYFYPCSKKQDFPNDLIFGTHSGPIDLDPQLAWDSASFNVIEQVCEGLFINNYSDPEISLIPALASDFGTWNGNNYTVDLRNGVHFHDGTNFDANDVVWTFDRIANLDSLNLSRVNHLYEYYDVNSGTNKPIINKTMAVDSDTVKFVLNTPFGPFEQLLSFSGSFILPSEGQIPFNNTLDTLSDDLIGTGPYDYQYYIEGFEVKFNAYENYWRGTAAISELRFSIYNNYNELNQALLDGEVDVIINPDPSYYPSMNSSNHVELIESGQSLTLYYLGMNNRKIPVEVRKAISYAINYSLMIEELYSLPAVRLKSPLPESIKYANWSFNVPVLNITHARIAMQNAGYGIGLDPTYGGPDDPNWRNSKFLSYNYTYNIGNQFREDILTLLQDNLEEIGIEVLDAAVTWTEFLEIILQIGGHTLDDLRLYFLGWLPEYNDPDNILNPLFSNSTNNSNIAQVNDYQVQTWIEEALTETNQTIREQFYDLIQQRLVEEVYPWCWGMIPLNFDAIDINLVGFPSNAFDRAYFYPCEWLLPSITINYPLNDTYGNSVLKLNVSVSHPKSNIAKVLGIIDNTYNFKLNHTENGIYVLNESISFLLSDGLHSLVIKAFDSSGNMKSSEKKYFTIYDIDPSVEILQPFNTYYSYSQVLVNVSVTDTSPISDVIAEIDNTDFELLTHGEGTYYYLNSSNFNDGPHTIRIWAYDEAINLNNTETISFTVDTINPTVDIIAPDNITYTSSEINISATCSDINGISQVLAEIDGNTNTSLTHQGSGIYSRESYLFGDGSHRIKIYAFDMAGNVNNTESVIFNVDSTLPSVSIFSPEAKLYGYSNIDINCTCSDPSGVLQVIAEINNLNNVSLTYGSGNHYSYTGYAFNDGFHTVRIYATDNHGNMNDQVSVSFSVDTTSPIIIIDEPTINSEYPAAPGYDITVTDPNLNQVWYTIDGGLNNVTISSFTGAIDSTLWNSLPNGQVTITFYANDDVGHINSESVIVFKDTPSVSPGIPGFDILLMLGISIMITFVILKKKFK
ncbi:MAG: hypothetical protein GF311_23355 [Candidatus Lokiarchaeota archaeon]|nr:hypothetical protein [Candidatus Lokiarchaeota archaeon]